MSVKLMRAEDKTQLCLQIKLAEENHNNFTHRNHHGERNKCTSRKKKNRYSECCKKVLYAVSKSTRNILTNLNPNPARPEKPGPIFNSDSEWRSRNVVIVLNRNLFIFHVNLSMLSQLFLIRIRST